MTDTSRMQALSSLAYEDEAPLGWRSVALLPQGAELHKLNLQNAQLLHADSALSEHVRAEPKEDNQPLQQELHRLEYKLDLMLRLLGSLLEQGRDAPVRRHFRVDVQGVRWRHDAAQPLPEGTCGIVSLYINQALPFPLQLPAQITSAVAEDGAVTLRAEFRGLNATMQELLDKLIFRHHRRQIAEARQAR